MRPLLLLLALLPCLCAAAPPTGAGWKVVWSDEFEGSSLDQRKWQHYLCGPRRQATNTPGAVAVGGGNLTITTFTKGGTHFTGMVASAATFLYTYGYVEARIDYDTSPGMWSAFWMQSPTMGDSSIYTTDPNLAGSEIDICEHRTVDSNSASIDAKIVGNLHWGGYGVDHQSTGYTSPNLDLGGGYHIYGMEWSPAEQKFYIDGVLRWTVDNAANSPVSNRSEYLWLSSEVQSDASVDWAGPIPAAGYGAFDTSTTKMRVDYVRVYQPAETVANGDFAGRLAPFDPTNQATWSSAGGKSGARAGKLAPTTAAGASLRQTLGGLMPDTGYTFSAWGNAGITSPSLFVGVEDHGFPTTGQTLTTNAYAQATVPFTTGASNRSATVVARANNAGSLAYVDDFLLRRNASVTNGQLETGDSDAWSSIYGGSVVAADGTSYGGDFSWKIPASAASAGLEQSIVGLSPSTAYRLTGWTTNGNAGLTFGVKNHGATQVTSTVAASAWTQATVNFTTGAAATGATVFAFRGSSAQTAYADAFFLSQPFAAPWAAADVGALALTGTSGRLGEKFVTQATGGNISGGSDRCHLIHQPLSGDGTLTALILGADIVSDVTKVGLMLRDSTAPNSRAVALTWNATTGRIDFLRRSTAGAGPAVTSTAAGSVPVAPWLRLTRRGSAFTPYWSADGVSWTRVDVPRTVTLSTAVFAGLVLATGDETRLGEAAFDKVSLTAAVPDVLITEPADSTTHAANGSSLRLVATLTGATGAAIQWSIVSGPGSVTFSNATTATTYATFSAPGIYQLRCAAANAVGTGTADLTIYVTPLSTTDSSLALHLKLDETSGTVATDSSGTSNHASTSGAVTWQPAGGKLQGAAVLDGSNAFLTVPDQASLDTTAAFTLSCWFKADTFNANSALLAKRVSDTSQNAYGILFGSGTNGGRFRIDINSNNDRFSSNTVFSTGAWYHIALVFDGTLPTAERAKLYVNGVLDVTAAETSTTVINSTAPMLIGRASETDTNFFDGMVDAVRFYRRALSVGEIAGLANESAVAAPIVSAGAAPAVVTQVAGSLAGSITAGNGAAPVAAWSKVSGPGTVTFGNAAQAATSVTFSQAGDYVLQLTATNSTAQTLATLTVTVARNPALFADWLALQWPGETNPAINGPTADPNGDGELNLYEYATAQNPNAATRALPGVVKNGANLEVTYTRANAALADGVTFTVEWSDTLASGSWSSVGVSEQLISDNGTVQTRKSTFPAGSTGKRFARLRVVK